MCFWKRVNRSLRPSTVYMISFRLTSLTLWRHWFSDCNGPRHRTPGLPQIMLMHIMLRSRSPFLHINTLIYLSRGDGSACHASECGALSGRIRLSGRLIFLYLCVMWAYSSQVGPAWAHMSQNGWFPRLNAHMGCVCLCGHVAVRPSTEPKLPWLLKACYTQCRPSPVWKHPICKYAIFKGLHKRLQVFLHIIFDHLCICVCRRYFVMLARCSLCILPLFYTQNS